MRAGATRALLALGVLLVACAGPPAGQGEPLVSATAQGEGNAVEVAVSGREVALDVFSNRGIGSATVELAGGPAPSSLELRLHLRALEELRLSYGGGATVASLASGPGHALTQRRVGPDGVERPLAPGEPGWLAVAIVSPEADPAFPLREGHIAVTLPPDMLAEAEGGLSIQWVDFFR